MTTEPSPPTKGANGSPGRRSRIVLLVALAFGLSIFAWWTVLATYPKTQGDDGWQQFKMLESAKWSVLRYREFPGWNAYECGGVPLWDNPTSFVGAPLAWLTFLIGTGRAILAWYVIHSALGFLSMWVLLRADLKLSRVACFIGSAMWAWNGFHQQHYGVGHVPFVPFEYFPLAIYLWRLAERDMRGAVALGVLLAWMMYEGAVYPLPHLAIVLAIESVFRVRPARRALAMAKAGAVVLGVAFVVGASRFIPVLHQLHIHNRGLPDEVDHIGWSLLRKVFLTRDSAAVLPGQEYKWHEYGGYVGPFLLFIALLGFLCAGAEQAWLVALLVVSFGLMLGHFGRWAPWHLLKEHVFPFKQMRVPSRFLATVLLALSAFAALAVDRFPARLRRPRGLAARPGAVRSALVLFGILGVGDMIGLGLSKLPDHFTQHVAEPVPPAHVSRRLYLGGGGIARSIDQPAQNRGRIKCWDEWGFERGAPLWEGDVAQARPADRELATVKIVVRTQNTFQFVVDAKAPTRVLLNTSYDDGWHTSFGTVVDADKQLAVDVPAGVSRARVNYRPYGLTAGLWLTGAGILGVIAFFVWDTKKRRSAIASTGFREPSAQASPR